MDKLRSLRNYIRKRAYGFAEWWTGTDEPSPKRPKFLEVAEAEFKSLRLEYDEEFFAEWTTMKRISGYQLSIMRRQVPSDMKRCDIFLGDRHVELTRKIDNEEVSPSGVVTNSGVGFHDNKDCRRAVVIVQPFGAGKTKTALMLSRAFVVLPIRWTKDHLLKKELEVTENTLFDALNPDVTFKDVERFSLRCERLMELALLSVAAVFNLCDNQSWFDALNEQHRLQFALLAIAADNALISEMAKWFEEHTEETNDQLRFDRLRKQVLDEVRERSGLRLVYVMDEVQELFELCAGYCLHTDWNKKPRSLENWKYETSTKKTPPKTEYSRCTDLYHQLGIVMNARLGVDAAFVMCSTMFGTWTTIENMSSPEKKLQEFTGTHWLTADDCKKLVQHYYKVSDELLNATKLDFGQFTRPRFACQFVTELYAGLPTLTTTAPEDVAKWLSDSYDMARQTSLADLKRKVQPLIDNPVMLDRRTTTSRTVLDKVVTSIRLCASSLPDAKKNEESAKSTACWRSYAQLADRGVMRFREIARTNQVEIADPLAACAVLACYSEANQTVTEVYQLVLERDAILGTVATHLNESQCWLSQDKSHKGFVFEKLLAYFAICGEISVPKYADTGIVAYEKLQSTADFAADYEEVMDSVLTEGEAAYVCDLLGDGNVRNPYVYLPHQNCGPDVLFRGKKVSGAVNVAIQSKAWSEVLNFDEFLKALKTVTPATMFANRAAVERAAWQARRETLGTEFMRIVFSELGFDDDVQLVVHEYNLRQAKSRKPSFIHLLNLDDLKDLLGPVYGVVVGKRIRGLKVQPNLIVDGVMRDYELNERLTMRLKKLALR